MATSTDTIRLLQVLLGGRRVQWTRFELSEMDGAPSSPTDGIDLLDSIYSDIRVHLREDAHRRTARLSITTLDLTATYTPIVGSNSVAFDATGSADVEEVLQGIAAAITADPAASALVTAEAIDADQDGTLDTVLVRGKTEEGFSIDFGASGAGVVAVVADAEACKARLYTSGRGQGAVPIGWALASGVELPNITRRGFDERAHLAARQRACLELFDVVGVDGDGASVELSASAWLGAGVSE